MTLGDLVLAAQANGAVDAAMEDILAKVLTYLKLDAVSSKAGPTRTA